MENDHYHYRFRKCQVSIQNVIRMLENLNLTRYGTTWTLSGSWYGSFLYEGQIRKGINGKDERTID